MQLRNSIDILDDGAQHLRDAPGLRDTAFRRVRRIAVRELRKLANSTAIHLRLERVEPFRCLILRRLGSAVSLHVSADEGSHQPKPDRALVIRGIAAVHIPLIRPPVRGILWRQCSQAGGSEQFASHHIEHAAPTRFVEHRVMQTDGKDLIRPNGRVPNVAIDHIEQTACVVVPEQTVEALQREISHFPTEDFLVDVA